MREEKLKPRKIKIVFYSIAILLSAQVIWWATLFLSQVNEISSLKQQLAGNSPEAIALAQKEAFHKRFMFLSESGFFLVVMGAGIFLIYRALRVEEKASSAQKSFVEIMSHESKTPLTALKLRLESVLEQHAQDPALERDLKLSLLEVRRLASLFDKAMSLSRAEREAFRPETLDLKTLIRSVVARMEPVIQERKVALTLEIPDALWVDGDVDGLRSSIQSLLENAVYYNDKAEKLVKLSAALTGKSVILSIDDNGPGISSADAERLFEKFYRGEKQQAVPGSGLGLYLARQIAEAHRGDLRIESSSLGGARFSLILPHSRATKEPV